MIDWASINSGSKRQLVTTSRAANSQASHSATIARIKKLKNWLMFRPQPADMPGPKERARRAAAWKIEKAQIEAEIRKLEATLPDSLKTKRPAQRPAGPSSPRPLPQMRPRPTAAVITPPPIQQLQMKHRQQIASFQQAFRRLIGQQQQEIANAR